MPSLLFSLRETKLRFVVFPLANMSAHNCGENPFTGVLIKKPMNLLPRIKKSARRGYRGLVSWGARCNALVLLATLKPEHPHSRNETPPHPVCNWQREMAWSGLMHYSQWYYEIIIWASFPKPIALLTWHPGGQLPSHSPQTKHVKLIPRLELVPGSHRQVSRAVPAPERGRKLTPQKGGVGLPLGWERDAAQAVWATQLLIGYRLVLVRSEWPLWFRPVFYRFQFLLTHPRLLGGKNQKSLILHTCLHTPQL